MSQRLLKLASFGLAALCIFSSTKASATVDARTITLNCGVIYHKEKSYQFFPCSRSESDAVFTGGYIRQTCNNSEGNVTHAQVDFVPTQANHQVLIMPRCHSGGWTKNEVVLTMADGKNVSLGTEDWNEQSVTIIWRSLQHKWLLGDIANSNPATF
ncbi:hypothetical protein [Dongshaea marina]|uniref:hypothetical protein n=1 Tax=Dongshaea marina TaxID=2047966 RepID=UPI000D3E9CBB|nr:hypothetical protein [Dongshaea marina]